MDSIVRVARDPLPILTDLFDASLHPERWCWQAIAVAVRRGLPDVVRFLGSHASPYQSELDGVFPMALAQQGPRPPHPPAGHDDNLYVNVETVTALAEIGVRIPPDQFLDFMDNVCKEKGYPERIEDEPVMAALLEIKEEGVAPPANWYATWKFIDRPHLLQQLMDHGILSPDGVDQCLRSCANAGRELGSDGMVDLAHRALSLGASRAKALLSAALEGNSSLMKLMLATKGHGENVKDPEVVMSMLQSQRFTAEMCDIILGPDRAAVLADPSLAVFNMVINKATQTANYVLFQMVNEGSVLGEVKALLDFGFRAKAAEVALAKSLGLQETAALMEGFGTAV
ncbi:hypothetical protein HK101_003912 [Irineochytrium annulatum]|nr:hypothetical protein HK101_003912 [Irineochytrium annulatum]